MEQEPFELSLPVEAPGYDAVVAELKLIRRQGIAELRQLELPALAQAVRAAGRIQFAGEQVSAPMIEELLRAALASMDGSQAASLLSLAMGLIPDYRGVKTSVLRELAAAESGVSVSQFRNAREPMLIGMLAEEILKTVHRHHLRLTALGMERRTAVTTRLAFDWLGRFEAMYRVWTPVSAIGGNLAAFRSTMLEDPAVWHQEPDEDGWEYSNRTQAIGHMRAALASYAEFQVERQRYIIEHGGLWLLSDAQAEQELADAVHRISWHSASNERDDSYLRIAFGDQSGGEEHNFFELLPQDQILRDTFTEWLEWGDACQCQWAIGEMRGIEPFATQRHHNEIDDKCWMHAVITACGDFMTLLDDDWRRIADWYRLPADRRPGVQGETLYEEWGRMR